MRTVLIGLDAFDPNIFETLVEQGRLPNLRKYVASNGYAHLRVPDPPQSEVSWTSIATGLNPGGHGMFDFVHRNPQTYAINVSLLPTKQGLGGTRFQPPVSAQTIFTYAVSKGYPATSLWWPATFPARPELAVRTIPGLGTPDLMGRLGVGTSYQSTVDGSKKGRKIPVEPLEEVGRDHYLGMFYGPASNKAPRGYTLPFELSITGDERATLTVGQQQFTLTAGEWSPILELSFRIGFLFSIRAVTQVILTHTKPVTRLYALPMQIHPLRSAWPYGTPGRFLKETWQEQGPFLTVGWPQDTTALEEQLISDEQFLWLCESILRQRERVLMYHLKRFDDGILAAVFDSLDRVQHMYLTQRPDIVASWYEKFDALVGRIVRLLRLQEKKGLEQARLVVASDHGFAPFEHKVHLNRWLLDAGYLVAHNMDGSAGLKDVNWSRSHAYAIGLNSIYLNLCDREGQGIVQPGERAALVNELCDCLQQWRSSDGEAVVDQALTKEQAFDGPLSDYGPDIVVGYAPGFRASQATGLGNWEKAAVEKNRDHWAADHCMSARSVPGVIFADPWLLKNYPAPSYRHIPSLALDAEIDNHGSSSAPPLADEDQNVIEERLKGLGYL